MVVSMDRWKGKVAIVTGASSGIGAAIAEEFAKAGLKVAALARREDRLLQLAAKMQNQPGKIHPIKADMSKEGEILAAFAWIKSNLGPVHILVNNAGIGRNTTLRDGETQDWKAILDVNVLGLSIATREAVKDMRANNVDGHIVHINSVLGHKVVGHDNINMYTGSKYAVTALTETLRQELTVIGSKIKITSISPGVVATEIRAVSGFTADRGYDEKEYKKLPRLESKDVADAVVYVVSTPPHVQVHELMIKPVGEPF